MWLFAKRYFLLYTITNIIHSKRKYIYYNLKKTDENIIVSVHSFYSYY